MKKILNVFLVILMVSCQNAQQKAVGGATDEKIDPNVVTCERIGPVKLNDTRRDLAERFGGSNLKEEANEIQGQSKRVTRVFPDTPEEVVVVWSQDGDKIERLLIRNEGGPYATKENLKVGISLRDIVRINNYLPLTFANFYKQTEGYAVIQSFNEGDIAKKYPCLGGTLEIVKFKGIDKYVLDDFKKKDTVKSSDKVMDQMVIKISEISIAAQ